MIQNKKSHLWNLNFWYYTLSLIFIFLPLFHTFVSTQLITHSLQEDNFSSGSADWRQCPRYIRWWPWFAEHTNVVWCARHHWIWQLDWLECDVTKQLKLWATPRGRTAYDFRLPGGPLTCFEISTPQHCGRPDVLRETSPQPMSSADQHAKKKKKKKRREKNRKKITWRKAESKKSAS